jgi:hypothetical protein
MNTAEVAAIMVNNKVAFPTSFYYNKLVAMT